MKRKNECQLTMIMWFVMFFILSACPLQALSVRFVTGTWLADVSPVVVVFGSMYCESLLSCTLEITGKTPDEEIIWNESDYEFSWTAGPLSGDGSTAEIYTGEYPGNNTITQPGRYYLTFSGSAKYWIQRTGGDGLPVREGPFYAELEPFNAQYTLTREFIVLDITSISGHGKSSARISYPQSGDSWSDGETLYVQPCSVLHLHAVLNPDVELDGSIPAGLEWSTTCSYSIVDDDDCRNLEVHVGSTTGEFIVTAYLSGSGNRSRMMRIVVVPMALHQVFFDGKTDIRKDGSDECYSGAVWQDDDLDGTSDLQNANADSTKNYQPVAYASTATLRARPVFKPNCRKSNGTMLTIDDLDVRAAVVKVRYGHPSLFSCNWTTPVAYPVGENTYISAISPFHSSAVVDYHGEYALGWEIGFGEAGTQDSDLYWRHSESRHELYLTWGAPSTNFETVFHIGCTKATGKSTANTIFQAIWNYFATRSVTRKDGIALTYYHSYKTTNNNTKQLLSYTDGNCKAWAKFFRYICMSQGINIIDLKLATIISSIGDGFFVKTWSFLGSGTSGDPLYPYRNSYTYSNIPNYPLNLLIGDNSYYWGTIKEVDYTSGTAGQNNPKPASLFTCHYMIKFNNLFYDPSYGLMHTTLQSIDDTLSGFWRFDYNYVYFCKNPSGLQITD